MFLQKSNISHTIMYLPSLCHDIMTYIKKIFIFLWRKRVHKKSEWWWFLQMLIYVDICIPFKHAVKYIGLCTGSLDMDCSLSSPNFMRILCLWIWVLLKVITPIIRVSGAISCMNIIRNMILKYEMFNFTKASLANTRISKTISTIQKRVCGEINNYHWGGSCYTQCIM